MSVNITQVISVGMTVADMDRSIDFYTGVLSCTVIADREVAGAEYDRLYGLPSVRLRTVTLQLGEQAFGLTEFLTPKGRPIPSDERRYDRTFQHLAIVVRDMSAAYEHLRHHGVRQTSPNPQTIPAWNMIAGGIECFYFQDPDGHHLELIKFPTGKGDAKWQRASDSHFLGIDHTAIVVDNTLTSRAFYCDTLGLKLQQESKNLGLEQERLSGTAKARVRISRLQASEGMGIELLEYLEPTDGRPMPIGTHANDLWFWQTTLAVETTDEPDPLGPDISAPPLGQDQLLQDPDGHTIRLATHTLN
jgi:catechol 2,3-dioxygenase-like lactoylglutathione lyase family enzyme